MIIKCGVKTVTEVVDRKVTISVIHSETGVDDKPTIFRTDLLTKAKAINEVSGKEGELLLTHIDSNENVGEINGNGELIISTTDDDSDNYYLSDKGELIYNSKDGQ